MKVPCCSLSLIRSLFIAVFASLPELRYHVGFPTINAYNPE
jgi:hypothetical protein